MQISNPRSWNQIDFGHYVVMGKDENGTPLLLDTQNPQRDWGNAPVTYEDRRNICLFNRRIHSWYKCNTL